MKKLFIICLTFIFGLSLSGCFSDKVSDEIDYLTIEELIEMAKNNTSQNGTTGEIEVTGTPNFNVPANAYNGEPVEITFYHTMGQALRDVLEKGIEDFNKLYPNIKVKHEQIGGYDDVRNQIATELTANAQPNLAYCYPDHVALYNLSNSVTTLDNLVNSTQTVTRADGTTETLGLTAAQKADFIQGYYNEGRQFGDGLMYSLPLSKSTEVLYYNRDFFEEHFLIVDENGNAVDMDENTEGVQKGVYLPTHWFSESADDKLSLEYFCKKIKEIDPNCIPLGYDSESNLFITMCEQLGSGYTTLKGDSNFIFDNAANKTFVREFRSWYRSGYMTTQEIFGAYTSGLFVATEGARSYMSIGSSAGASHQRPTKVDGAYPFQVGIASIPQMNPANPKVISQGPSLCIFQKDNPTEVVASWLFAKFLATNVKFQASFSMASGYVPVIKSVMDNPTYKASFLDLADGGDNVTALSVKVCLEQSDAYYTSPAFNGSSKARDQVGLILTSVLVGEASDESSLNKLINRAFADAIANCEASQ